MKTPQIAPLPGMTPLGLPAPATETQRQIAELLAKRRPPAGSGKLFQGGLFDDVERRQIDLFGDA
jgi:hypothetical protein